MQGLVFDGTRIASAVVLTACFVLSAVPAGAQSSSRAPGTSAQDLNPAQRIPSPVEPEARGDLLSAPEAGPCPLRSSNLTFTLSSVSFQGADTLSEDDLAPITRDYIGKTVPVAALCELRDRAAQFLFHRNLFVRVEIPAQKISGGHVVFDVVEAHISRLHVLGDDSAAQSKVEDYIEKLRGMNPFNIALAQRDLLLASDVPGVEISATMKSGGNERGAVELDVTVVSHRNYDALVNVENFGSSAVGPFGGLLRADFDSVTPYGDRSTFIDYQTFDLKKQSVFQAIEEVRIGDDGWIAQLSLSTGDTHPQANLTPVDLYSLAYTADFNLDYPVVRTRSTNWDITPGFQYVDEKVNAAASTLSRDHLRIFYLRTSGNANLQWEVPVALAGALELRKGIEALGASPSLYPLLSRPGGNPAAFVARSNANATVGPYDDVTGVLNFQGQISDTPLLTYEQQAIGNFTIGRGYDPASLNGDRAIAGSAEVHYAAPPVWLVAAAPYAFYDIARVWNLTVGSQQREVRSLGAGVAFQIASRFRIDVFYAHPMDRVSSVATQVPGDRVFISLTGNI
jgi:hemolysin activation/secretion protein